jgi:uncharacterized membrane protein YjjP (DUF1212 family)
MTVSGELPTPSARARSREELADYLLDIGATLASYGCPSYRLEDVIRAVADAEGYRAEPFALATGLFLRVTPKEPSSSVPEVHRMTRVSAMGVDLERLVLVDEIFNDVLERTTSIDEARVRIRGVAHKPPLWSSPLGWAATTVASAAAAVFFGGGVVEVLVAGIAGALIGGSRLVLGNPQQRLLHEFLGGLLAAVAAWLATRVWHHASLEVIVLAGAISLFPGMTFTTGLAEVAQKNLVAGGARLMESAVTLVLILFGFAVIAGLQEMLGVHLPAASPRAPLGLAWQALALVASSISFGVLFQIPKRFMWAALASGATGYAVTAIAVRHLPGHLAAFCAALAVSVLANALARRTQRPAQLFQLPGMMLLVPGSFGFLSFGDFLRGQYLEGASHGFTMVMTGAALVIGVLVANVVLPARKLL